MNKKQKLLVGFLVLFLVVFFGASCVQDAVVPCEIDEKALEYTGENATQYVPWTTIHLTKQETAKRLSEDDVMYFDYINNAMTINFDNAQQVKGAVFDPTGPLALMFPALAGLGLGRYMKSPREQELEKKVG